MKVTEPTYTLCLYCDHFIEPNDVTGPGIAKFLHLDNGEKEHDHDAVPSALTRTLSEWRATRPDLFVMHDDGMIGPNSAWHVTEVRS